MTRPGRGATIPGMDTNAPPAPLGPPGSPAVVVATLEARDPTTLTKAERKALNTARNQVRRAKIESPKGAAGTGRASVRELPSPPDPFAPDALRQLFAASFRAVWNLVHDPGSTNRDLLEAFSAVGRVSGMGKEAPQAEKFSLPMASLLPATEPKPGEPT